MGGDTSPSPRPLYLGGCHAGPPPPPRGRGGPSGLIGDQEPAKNYGKDGVINVQHGSQYCARTPCERASSPLFSPRLAPFFVVSHLFFWIKGNCEKVVKTRKGDKLN